LSSLPKAVIDQVLRQIDQKLKHRHDSREGCRSINTDMQIASRVRTLPPFKIQSRAMVRNFNANFLQGKTLEQIVAEAQGGYSPHPRLHDHSLAADGNVLMVTGNAWPSYTPPVALIFRNEIYMPWDVGETKLLDMGVGAVSAFMGVIYGDNRAEVLVSDTQIYFLSQSPTGYSRFSCIPDNVGVQLGLYNREGSDIAVYRDASGNMQMFLDADADGATVKTGLEVYADIKVGRVGSGFVYKSPNGTTYRLIIDNNGFVSVEPEAGGTAISPVHSVGEYGDETTLKGHVKLEEGSGVTITRSDAHNSLVLAAAGGGAAHNILDGDVHLDSLLGNVVAGDLMIGNATPKWARLAKGSDGELLKLSAGLPTWGKVLAGNIGVLPSCRVYHDANQSIPSVTDTVLAFNSERWDTDSMHDLVTNNSRITIKTAGKYAIFAHIEFAANDAGYRQMHFLLNGATYIAFNEQPTSGSGDPARLTLATLWDFAVDDFVQVRVRHNIGANLNVNSGSAYSPEFAAIFQSA